MPKFAANLTWMFNEYEFPERFAAAKNLNFKAVECQFPYAWDRALLADRQHAAGLKMIMFNMPPGNMDDGDYGLAALPGREQEFQDSVKLALTYAHSLNCQMLHMLAGIISSNRSREEYFETYIQNLRWAAKQCAKSGVAVLVEPINTIERPGYLISTTTQARMAIDQAKLDNIAMQFDFHNAQLMEGNLTSALHTNLKYIRHMQIAGVPNRTPPDKGEMNYDYLFDLVDELGYQGWLGCEFFPGDRTTDGLSWARAFGIGT